ncbi:hypothetical protein B0T19DRAFT_485619 [Cercophora scortea]|uniref:FAD-binding PCMH-type domain-containing protein n=1 Tax=Cercophora scortea TaxID=314031 RepID=A0AAE0IDI5_9PEZI|nr:hypothetical protein B0T19DRAFT_485619 [Cercophora scortea]
MRCLLPILSFATIAVASVSVNFPWEAAQLTANETATYPDIAFGDATGSNATYSGPKCKVGPGDSAWPTDYEWTRFNRTLGGVLLKPLPPGAVCYPGPYHDATKCNFLLTGAAFTRFYADDPVTVLTDWPEGNTCLASASPVGNCTQGGYPVYVVNATKVRHIQMAVNFARNRNLRLVIKNTGHDFGGRSTGAGALSIWTHYLKDFEYIPEYSIDRYKGRVARVSAGIEAWELWNYMDKYNITMVVPGGDTVGAYGGWIAGGGHNSLSSYYGHGSDQVLAFQVVTADGKYRSVSPHQNADLFFAMLGGGGSTYGVLTSAIVKVHPPTPVTNIPLSFQVGSGSPFGSGGFNFTFPTPGNGTFPFPFNTSVPFNTTIPGFPFPGNGTFPGAGGNFSFPFPPNGSFPAFTPPITVNSTAVFWEGVRLYQQFAPAVTDAGGTLYSYVTKVSNTSYTFTTTFELPNLTARQAQALVQPLYTALNAIGIPVNNSLPETTASFAQAARTGAGDSPGNMYFGSRLFPRANWDNETIYNATFAAIRAAVEAGYVFHGINHAANYTVAGYPGNTTAISPIWRRALMHADIFDYGFRTLAGVDPETLRAGYKKFSGVMEEIRRVTPGGGAYYNEADVQEPSWQTTFFGPRGNYARLLAVKEARDPWGLFWAPTMPGSERWEVVGGDVGGLPTQNGPLCLVGGERVKGRRGRRVVV